MTTCRVDLTDEELNIEIAKFSFCGMPRNKVPDFCNDYNAALALQNRFTSENLIREYMVYLYAIVFERELEGIQLYEDKKVKLSANGFCSLMSATARQRAEAGYLAMVEYQPIFRRTLLYLTEE